jgi:hypothetical protein
MKKTVLFILAGSMLLLSPAVFAQNKPAEPPKEPAGQSQPPAGRRFDNLTPEEQAKLKEKWQTMSPEDRAKLRDQMRDRVATQNAQGQTRKDVLTPELARLQEQHKASMGELEAIRQLAIKENAKETTEALAKLIAKQEKQFNQQMQALRRRMKILQAGQEAQAGAPTQTQTPANKPPTPEPKKEEPKPQGAGTKR